MGTWPNSWFSNWMSFPFSLVCNSPIFSSTWKTGKVLVACFVKGTTEQWKEPWMFREFRGWNLPNEIVNYFINHEIGIGPIFGGKFSSWCKVSCRTVSNFRIFRYFLPWGLERSSPHEGRGKINPQTSPWRIIPTYYSMCFGFSTSSIFPHNIGVVSKVAHVNQGCWSWLFYMGRIIR